MTAGQQTFELDEVLDVLCVAARTLIADGHPTEDSVHVLEGLARAYGHEITVASTWSAVTLVGPGDQTLRTVTVMPIGVNMGAVTATLATIHRARHAPTPPAPDILGRQLAEDAVRPPYPDWLFALACATGAVGLAVIFGAVRPSSYVLIPVAAAAGGFLRRFLGRHGIGLVGQGFAAALVAGLAGALSVHLDLTSGARLVAVCPAMVLVPGPHLLNGALDIGARRMSTGVGRLAYGGLILLGISGGLMLGLMAGGSLPVTATTRSIPLWLDIPAAMLAAASYPIYFSLDLRLIVWPVIAGGLAHAARWIDIVHAGGGMVSGGFLACLLAGLVLGPVARRHHVSFAGVGFAAVVCLVPGMYVFRAASGMLQMTFEATAQLQTEVSGDLATAVFTLTAMVIGLGVGRRLTSPRKT